MIEILDSGPLTTVQDLGRPGYEHIGIMSSGAMDTLALQAANLMVGNVPEAAALEVTIAPFSARLHADMRVAVTGGHYQFSLDDQIYPSWWCVHAKAGQLLRILPAQASGRTYVAFEGALDLPLVMGSRATDLKCRFGGHEGHRLQRGDRLSRLPSTESLSDHPSQPFGLKPPAQDIHDVTLPRRIRIIPAAEHALLTTELEALLYETHWKVSAESNRMGFRFKGPALKLDDSPEMRSYGIVNGLMQLPPDGHPIIQLCEANSMGGYPKLGVVIQADLRLLAQCAIGTKIQFVVATREEALRALSEQTALLRTWKNSIHKHLPDIQQTLQINIPIKKNNANEQSHA